MKLNEMQMLVEQGFSLHSAQRDFMMSNSHTMQTILQFSHTMNEAQKHTSNHITLTYTSRLELNI